MERVDLIQDLRFETATTRIKATPDGEFLIASGYCELAVFVLLRYLLSISGRIVLSNLLIVEFIRHLPSTSQSI